MSDLSARLAMPYLLPSQAQKHVTHNEALSVLDTLVQMAVEAVGSNDPSATPEEGEIWALGGAPTGDWAGHADELAVWNGEAWVFVVPQAGWRLVDKTDNSLRVWDGAAWVVPPLPDLNNLPGVGINASHDATNRLSVAAPATLLTHEGAGHQLKINKDAAADTASLLFQTGFSGRAEMGTNGSDDFSIKVSDDGTNWQTGVSFDGATGNATVPNGLAVNGDLTGAAVQSDATDTTAGKLLTVGAFGLGKDAGPDITNFDTHYASGMYAFLGGGHGSATPGDNPYPSHGGAGGLLSGNRSDGDEDGYLWQMAFRFAPNIIEPKVRSHAGSGGDWSDWVTFWTTENTTVDGNGFVKEASPIVRLSDTGAAEPVRPVGAVFAKSGTGHYTLTDVEPLALSGWQIEVPQDANGNRLVFVETDYDADARSLTVRTSEVAWDGVWTAGAPKDIPAGRWIDLRFHEEAPEVDEV